jgi:hypothetical protein
MAVPGGIFSIKISEIYIKKLARNNIGRAKIFLCCSIYFVEESTVCREIG